MRRIALACGLGVTLAASGCLGGGGGGGSAKPGRNAGHSGNRSPQISGNPPPEVLANDFFDFRPSTSDPDGDRLVYSISHKPAWARFDAETGRLFGRPESRDIGIYTGIVIVASDGRASSELPAFDVVVTDSAPGAVTLTWMPPTENEDGTVLHDLAGYRIYIGRHKRELNRVIVLNNPGLTAYVVDNLPPAKWYFAMTSFNSRGQESRRSAVIKKRVG
jgi:Putative Ig domain